MGGSVTAPDAPLELAMATPATSTKVSFRLSGFSTLVLLGAGTAAVVHYLGVKESKKIVEDGMKEARAWSLSCAKWADAKITAAGLKPYRNIIVAHISVVRRCRSISA